MNTIAILISIFGSVVSGAALFFFKRYFDKRDKKDEERDKAKAEENVLILKSINAVGRLTVANSIALKNKKTNGEMDDALENYERVDAEMRLSFRAKR
jgi:C4-dicarboxylate transporter